MWSFCTRIQTRVGEGTSIYIRSHPKDFCGIQSLQRNLTAQKSLALGAQNLARNSHQSLWWPCSIELNHGFRERDLSPTPRNPCSYCMHHALHATSLSSSHVLFIHILCSNFKIQFPTSCLVLWLHDLVSNCMPRALTLCLVLWLHDTVSDFMPRSLTSWLCL